jgi:hypothetical protein
MRSTRIIPKFDSYNFSLIRGSVFLAGLPIGSFFAASRGFLEGSRLWCAKRHCISAYACLAG